MNATPVIKEILVNASPAKVWRAITDPEEMKVWYFDLPGFKAEKGYQFSFYGETADGTKYLHLCEVQEVEVNKKLSYTWKYEGYTGVSLVTFELFPDGDKTLVKLTHSGIESFDKDNKDLKKSNFDGGWEAIVKESLKHFVETR